MKILLIFIIALATAIGIGIFLENDPGRFIFVYHGVTVQLSFALFIIMLVLAFTAFYLLLTLIRDLTRLPRDYRKWKSHRRYRQAEKYLSRGCLEMLEGDWSSAEETFRKGSAFSREPMLNYLFAAKAAQQQNAVTRRDHYLRLAQESCPESSSAAGLTRAELQLNRQQTEQAYATLQQLHAQGTAREQVKLLLLDAGSQLMEWRQVMETLSEPSVRKILPPEKILARQLEACAGLLKQAGASQDKEVLDREWKKIPGKLRSELYLIEVYTGQCLNFPDTSNCEVLLRKTLRHNYDRAIMHRYGLVHGDDAAQQLRFAEKLLPAHSRDPVLLLTLGRLCKTNRLWGKARSYLEASLSIEPAPETYRELATLLELEGDHAVAAEYFRAGLESATGNTRPEDLQRLQDLNTGEIPVAHPRLVS
jgi:HemY protein